MTLTDLLISISVLGVVMTANVTLLDSGRRAWQTAAAHVEAQENARIALARLAADLRTAGAGPAPTFAPVSMAEPTRIVFHRDEDQDGFIGGTRETITWTLDRTILRRDAGGGAQPIINGVRALTFAYFDAAGAPTGNPGEVRSVEITLTTEASTMPHRGPGTTLSTRVRFRNR